MASRRLVGLSDKSAWVASEIENESISQLPLIFSVQGLEYEKHTKMGKRESSGQHLDVEELPGKLRLLLYYTVDRRRFSAGNEKALY